jgi:hypothetical protein
MCQQETHAPQQTASLFDHWLQALSIEMFPEDEAASPMAGARL